MLLRNIHTRNISFSSLSLLQVAPQGRAVRKWSATACWCNTDSLLKTENYKHTTHKAFHFCTASRSSLIINDTDQVFNKLSNRYNRPNKTSRPQFSKNLTMNFWKTYENVRLTKNWGGACDFQKILRKSYEKLRTKLCKTYDKLTMTLQVS